MADEERLTIQWHERHKRRWKIAHIDLIDHATLLQGPPLPLEGEIEVMPVREHEATVAGLRAEVNYLVTGEDDPESGHPRA